MRGLIGRGLAAADGAYEPLRREAIYVALEDEAFVELRSHVLLARPSEEHFQAWMRERFPYETLEPSEKRKDSATDASAGVVDAGSGVGVDADGIDAGARALAAKFKTLFPPPVPPPSA